MDKLIQKVPLLSPTQIEILYEIVYTRQSRVRIYMQRIMEHNNNITKCYNLPQYARVIMVISQDP